MRERICSVEDCEKRAKSRGWCSTHYNRWYNHGSTDPVSVPLPRASDTCVIPGCDGPVRSYEWCYKHYMRWYRHGDPLANMRAAKPRECQVDGCTKDGNSGGYGWCKEHYDRWLRSGDPTWHRPAPTGWVNRWGYRVVSTLSNPHPIQTRDGRAFEHRLVLYAKIGPGEHPCTWCGRLVTWDESWPESMVALVTDHLNFDRLDNRPANLVPSCQPCNYTRHA